MAKEIMTDEMVELEIERLLQSEDVKLAKREQQIKYKRRQYMYTLRSMEKRGKELAKQGLTVANIEKELFGNECDKLCSE
jgi:hypothetical protein